ncbi:MAG: hypothetical protein NTX42_11350 [Methanothrix sp.]|nr:hypothetical protein [Methanothrix sp.]
MPWSRSNKGTAIEFKSIGARNNALKLLEKNGFDYDLVEDLKGYVVLGSPSTSSMPRS